MAKYSDSDSGFFAHSVLPFQQECEGFARQSLLIVADLLIESLDQTSRVVQRTEELGRQVRGLMNKMTDHHQDFRQHNRLRVQETLQDGVEICTEIIHGLGQVIRTGLDEASEIQQHSEQLRHRFSDSWQELPNPFRSRATQKTSRTKAPTIIPISIQDN